MHNIDEYLWEGDGSEALEIHYSTSHEDNEGVYPLGVAGGPYGNSPCGPLLHCVVVGFVDLGVISKLEA